MGYSVSRNEMSYVKWLIVKTMYGVWLQYWAEVLQSSQFHPQRQILFLFSDLSPEVTPPTPTQKLSCHCSYNIVFSSFRTLHTSTSAITRIGLRNVATDKENSVANPSHLWNQERFHFVTRAHMCYCMYFHPYVYSLNL